MNNLNIYISKYEAIYLANKLINYGLKAWMEFFKKSMLHKLLETMQRGLSVKLYTEKGEENRK